MIAGAPISFKEIGPKSLKDFGALTAAVLATENKQLILRLLARTMDINARVISGSDPGAVPGGSTNIRRLGMDGAETGSTDV